MVRECCNLYSHLIHHTPEKNWKKYNIQNAGRAIVCRGLVTCTSGYLDIYTAARLESSFDY